MLRIITGKLKGRVLDVPEVSRPITDRIRTSIFDTITPIIDGSSVLDLYAGSGAFGLEAISRGAKKATFVELDESAVYIIRKNINTTKTADQTEIYSHSVLSFLKKTEEEFDIIMLDPPFALTPTEKHNDLERCANCIAKGGIIIFRFPTKESYKKTPDGLEFVFSKKFGLSTVNYYRKPA